RHDPYVQDRINRPFRVTHSLRSTRVAFIKGELRRALGDGSSSPLAVEEGALELVDAALPRGGTRGLREPPSRPHAEVASAIQVLLGERFREPVRLGDLAQAVGCSRFHLSRLFREVVGLPIHAYQLRLRLQAAIERLADGERDLTRMALELGFADHAH